MDKTVRRMNCHSCFMVITHHKTFLKSWADNSFVGWSVSPIFQYFLHVVPRKKRHNLFSKSQVGKIFHEPSPSFNYLISEALLYNGMDEKHRRLFAKSWVNETFVPHYFFNMLMTYSKDEKFRGTKSSGSNSHKISAGHTVMARGWIVTANI
jgi:hypothetical protein